jgi:hypothetical protein
MSVTSSGRSPATRAEMRLLTGYGQTWIFSEAQSKSLGSLIVTV